MFKEICRNPISQHLGLTSSLHKMLARFSKPTKQHVLCQTPTPKSLWRSQHFTMCQPTSGTINNCEYVGLLLGLFSDMVSQMFCIPTCVCTCANSAHQNRQLARTNIITVAKTLRQNLHVGNVRHKAQGPVKSVTLQILTWRAQGLCTKLLTQSASKPKKQHVLCQRPTPKSICRSQHFTMLPPTWRTRAKCERAGLLLGL